MDETRINAAHLEQWVTAVFEAAFVASEPAAVTARSLVDADLGRQPTAPGFGEILLPGEIEARKRAANLRDGIALTPALVTNLQKLGQERGVEFPHKPPSTRE